MRYLEPTPGDNAEALSLALADLLDQLQELRTLVALIDETARVAAIEAADLAKRVRDELEVVP